jgi:hypothetical protein
MIDQDTKSVIDAYFKGFDEYVNSMTGMLLKSRADYSAFKEQWKNEDRPANAIILLKLMEEKQREIDSLEGTCDDGVLYDSAHDAALSSMSDDQNHIFRSIPATMLYDRLIELYAEKYQREILAKEEALCLQCKQMNADSSRTLSGASTLLWEGDFNGTFATQLMELSNRYLGNAWLVKADCQAGAHAQMPIRHPEITQNAINAGNVAHAGIPMDRVPFVHVQVHEMYASLYTGHDAWEWESARDDLITAYKSLVEHEASKPSLMEVLTSVGRASSKWHSEQTSLLSEFSTRSNDFMEIDGRRHSIGSDIIDEESIEYADQCIRETYPELAKKFDEYVQQEWRESNNQRLQEQERRLEQNGGQECPQGLTR